MPPVWILLCLCVELSSDFHEGIPSMFVKQGRSTLFDRMIVRRATVWLLEFTKGKFNVSRARMSRSVCVSECVHVWRNRVSSERYLSERSLSLSFSLSLSLSLALARSLCFSRTLSVPFPSPIFSSPHFSLQDYFCLFPLIIRSLFIRSSATSWMIKVKNKKKNIFRTRKMQRYFTRLSCNFGFYVAVALYR